MSAQLLDGKNGSKLLREAVKADLAAAAAAQGIVPTLAVMRVGDDESSAGYARAIDKTCQSVGVTFRSVVLPATAGQAEVAAALAELNTDATVHGIMILEPLPAQIDHPALIELLNPAKDVDGVHPLNAGRLAQNKPPFFVPATPAGGLWADRDEVRRAVGNGAVCTLNALTASVHAGTSPLHYGRKGRIRGSVNVPYPALLADDGCLRPVADLRQAFDAVGALSSPRVICYCGGGIAATLDALALLLAGQPQVAVYDGSLADWAADPELPMDTGD